MSSEFGRFLRISIFGESHGDAVGVVMDGLPAGFPLDTAAIRVLLERRAPGRSLYVSQRREEDDFHIVSGLYESRTCGTPLCALIENHDMRARDYDDLARIPRPGHSDYTTFVKYGHRDHRGGGHLSGRLTAPLCFAGAVCSQYLQQQGIAIGGHIQAAGGVEDDRFDSVALKRDTLLAPGQKAFPVLNDDAGEGMKQRILEAREQRNSVGGIIECAVLGLPPGVGEPIFDGLENRLAAALFAIPAICGVEFGDGFAAAAQTGSQHNDCFYGDGQTIRTRTNHAGGILGGISTGMPLLLRVAVKPTPSIGQPQESVDLISGKAAAVTITGRHDPAVVVRAVPCVEAVCAIVLLDMLMESIGRKPNDKQS